jgi:hypothetical protein
MKLDPYVTWSPDQPPVDPRTAELGAVADCLEQLVIAEGPILLSLAIRRYIGATPDLSRAGGAIRSTMRRAVDRLVTAQRLAAHGELGSDDEHHLLLVAPEQQLMPRERADRTLGEIPVSELASMMLLVRSARGVSNYTETVQRGILSALDLKRLTGPTRDRLLAAWHVAGRWLTEGNSRPRPAAIETRPLEDLPPARSEKKAAPAADPDVPAWQAALRGPRYTSR